jgi:hypothetical protein
VVVWFTAASVAEACGKQDEHEPERIRVPGEGGQDAHEHEHEAQGREDAVEQAQERSPVIPRERTLFECQQEPRAWQPDEAVPCDLVLDKPRAGWNCVG